MSQLYKRLLILAVMVVSLTWVTQNPVAQGGTCAGCTATYTSCQAACNGNGNCLNNCHSAFVNCQSVYCHSAAACEQCSDVYFSCLIGCEQARQDCIATGTPSCNETGLNCSSGCDNSYSACRNQNCGGGGGGGLGCNGSNNGYSQSCANLERGNRDNCIAYGSSGSTYQTCMSNYNDPEYCCDQQINADIQANCQCVIDSRNPDCVCNP